MSINRVIIEGYLTRDVEMRATASGLAVAGFTVAVNEKRKNAEGEYVDAPVFVKCSLFGTRAEKLSKQIVTVQCDSEEKALRTAMARTVSNPKNDVLVSIKADMIERKEA